MLTKQFLQQHQVWVPALVFGFSCWLFVHQMPILISEDKSMGATIRPGSWLLLVRSLSWSPPQRGELVVSKMPPFVLNYLKSSPKFQANPDQKLPLTITKRVTHIPGDGVVWQDKKLTLGPGEYWLEGDDLEESVDSNFFGPVSQENLLGRAVVIFSAGGNEND